MNRKERRKINRTYHGIQREAQKIVDEHSREVVRKAAMKEINAAREDAFNDAVNQAMLLTLVLPIKVLMDFYWPRSYKRRLPGFVNHLLDYYSRWQNGEWDIDELKQELWEYGGVKIIEQPLTEEERE